MYDELVKRLRDDEAWKNCDFDFIYGWMHEAADAIAEQQVIIRAQKAVLIQAPHWIPVSERLPEEGKYVLAYSADDDFTTVEARHKFEAFQITHWMPLPEPPKEQ